MTAPTIDAQASSATRGRVQFLLRWLVSLGLIALSLFLVDVRQALAAVADARPVWLVAGFILSFLGTILLPSILTSLAMRVQDRQLGLISLIEINLTNRFYILVLPRAAAVAIRWYRYGQGKLSAPGLALMLFERGIQLATLMLAALVAIAIDGALDAAYSVPITLALAAGTGLALVLLLPFVSEGAERMSRAVLTFAARILPAAIVVRLERLVAAAAIFRTLDKHLATAIMGWSLAATMCFFASAWFAAGAIGLEISLLSLVWIRSLVFLMTLVPITIGGIGVRELGFVGLLSLIGVAAPQALAFSAVNFAFQVVLAMIGAVIEASSLVLRNRAKAQGVKPC